MAIYICDYCRLDYKGRDRDASENVDLVCDSCNVNYFKEEEEEENETLLRKEPPKA